MKIIVTTSLYVTVSDGMQRINKIFIILCENMNT